MNGLVFDICINLILALLIISNAKWVQREVMYGQNVRDGAIHEPDTNSIKAIDISIL
jgi:hypothetical protein